MPRERTDSADSVRTLTAETRLLSGRRVLAKLRWKMAVTTVLICLLLACFYQLLYLNVYLKNIDTLICSRSWDGYVLVTVVGLLFYGRFTIVSLGPLADDTGVTRLVLCIDIVTTCVVDYGLAKSFLGHVSHWTTHVEWASFHYRAAVFLASDIGLVLGLLVALVRRTAPAMQRNMWDILRLWLWSQLLINSVSATLWAIECRNITCLFCWTPGILLVLYLASRPHLRFGCQKLLINSFENRSQARAAAGVAGLIGACSVSEVMAQAVSRFRSVELAELSFEDIRDNTPDPALTAKTSTAWAGRCDAFVSHSWHDNAQAKWKAMQRWREEFIAENGREPRVWFDKCCIDQNNIESDLRCLPVFLSGCRRLVVFCGPTYLSRLWCIMEIFTFAHMGRGLDKIEFRLVLQEDHEEHDASVIESAFEKFDAQECECFVAADKEKMLSIIHTAFGDVVSFNKEVRAIFRQTCWQDVWMEHSQSLRTGRMEEGVFTDHGSPMVAAPSYGEVSSSVSDTTSGSRADEDSDGVDDRGI